MHIQQSMTSQNVVHVVTSDLRRQAVIQYGSSVRFSTFLAAQQLTDVLLLAATIDL
jgi:predicted RNA-binding protein with PIN domain